MDTHIHTNIDINHNIKKILLLGIIDNIIVYYCFEMYFK